MLTRDFDLGDVLSVTTGLLVSPRHIEGVYDIMGFVLDDPGITTILLAMMHETVQGALLAQHPQLAVLNTELAERRASGTLPEGKDGWSAWLHMEKARFGATLPVRQTRNSPGAPSLDAQVAHVLALNPNAQVLTVEAPDDRAS